MQPIRGKPVTVQIEYDLHKNNQLIISGPPAYIVKERNQILHERGQVQKRRIYEADELKNSEVKLDMSDFIAQCEAIIQDSPKAAKLQTLVRNCTLEELEKETEIILDNIGGKIVPITNFSRSTQKKLISPISDQRNSRPKVTREMNNRLPRRHNIAQKPFEEEEQFKNKQDKSASFYLD